MILFIISVLAGIVFFILTALILRPVFVLIRDIIRFTIYWIGIDTFTRKDKIELGWIEEAPPAPPINLKAKMVSNCVLSKEDFPSIAEYFPDYKEYEVVERNGPEECKDIVVPRKNDFEGMGYKQQLERVEMLMQKKKDGTLDPIEEAHLAILGDPGNLRQTKEQEILLKRLRS